jgi:hypothetical protein
MVPSGRTSISSCESNNSARNVVGGTNQFLHELHQIALTDHATDTRPHVTHSNIMPLRSLQSGSSLLVAVVIGFVGPFGRNTQILGLFVRQA